MEQFLFHSLSQGQSSITCSSMFGSLFPPKLFSVNLPCSARAVEHSLNSGFILVNLKRFPNKCSLQLLSPMIHTSLRTHVSLFTSVRIALVLLVLFRLLLGSRMVSVSVFVLLGNVTISNVFFVSRRLECCWF